MYEKLLSESEKYIEAHKTKEVPILELWDEMSALSEELTFDMPENLGDFEMLIEGDKRFIFVAAKIEDEIEEVDIGEEEGEYEVGEDFFEVEKLEKLGFNQDQIVGLKKYEKKKSTGDDDDEDAQRPKGNSHLKHGLTNHKSITAHIPNKKNPLPKEKQVKVTSKITKSTRGKK